MGKFINSFFEKYKNLTPPNFHLKEAYREIIKDRFGVLVDDKDITIRNTVIFLNAPPTLKSELFLHKQEVLEKLKNKISKTSTKIITDLR